MFCFGERGSISIFVQGGKTARAGPEARNHGQPCTTIKLPDANAMDRSRLLPYSFKKPLITGFDSPRINPNRKIKNSSLQRQDNPSKKKKTRSYTHTHSVKTSQKSNRSYQNLSSNAQLSPQEHKSSVPSWIHYRRSFISRKLWNWWSQLLPPSVESSELMFFVCQIRGHIEKLRYPVNLIC
ncbi:hypothetical protein TNCV_4667611 [Trichonephila clavipes]|nr:hypothetical protein TNCV_4667611 [Trichonephila clavipes]